MGITIGGLATGLDTDSIISGLLKIQQNRVDTLSSRRAEFVQKQSAFKGIEAQLLSLRGSLGQLSGTLNSVFNSKTATVSDESIVSAAASDTAVPGVYTLTVNELAKANQVASQGFADPESEITQGTLELQVGSENAVTITIDSTNNTLLGLSQAINNSDGDVSSRIINDGSGTPYRLLLTSNLTGVSNTITITNNLAASSGDAVQPTFDTANPVQEAADAEITLGSGVGALTINSETNQVDELIPGVSLDLNSADASKEITIRVDNDTEGAQTAIEGFVDSYNSVIGFLNSQQAFNEVTETAAPLLGDRTAISIQDELQQALTTVIPGLDSGVNRLSQIGITFGDDGKLNLDSSKLQEALNGEDGITVADLRRLFALDGVSDNPAVAFVSGGNNTLESPTDGYEVNVTAIDTQATIIGNEDLDSASIVVDSSNNEFELVVDDVSSGTITITEGTYTRAELITQVQAAIDADTALSGLGVTVAEDSNKLRLTSDEGGADSYIEFVGGTAASLLKFDGGENDRGFEVVGQYEVDGETETAYAVGNILVGDAGNENTDGLQVRVSLISSQVVAGSEATVQITRGFGARLDQILGELLDPVDGDLKIAEDGFADQIEDIDTQIEAANALFEARQESLIAQFIALETAVSSLQNQGNILAAQLGGISSFNQNNNN